MARQFQYFCTVCNTQATKPPCRREKDEKPMEGQAGLGHWTCPKCGKKPKVRRVKV